jgi:hypothetical protein
VQTVKYTEYYDTTVCNPSNPLSESDVTGYKQLHLYANLWASLDPYVTSDPDGGNTDVVPETAVIFKQLTWMIA